MPKWIFQLCILECVCHAVLYVCIQSATGAKQYNNQCLLKVKGSFVALFGITHVQAYI